DKTPYARIVRANGEVVVREAMSEVEMATFSEVGQLEAFNTDGLRTLLRSMKHIPIMREKTLRYPGHIGLIRALRDAGFFSTKPVEVNGGQLVPLDITAKILIDQWKLLPGEQEFTVMRVEVKGKKDGKPRQITYELYDETDSISGTSSMARTTGYTCAAVVNLLAEGRIEQSGIVPPEEVSFYCAVSCLHNSSVIALPFLK
ncbi:MAG: saccharopine dehydrogenase family protein, partial [Flavobacteriales bacterium]